MVGEREGRGAPLDAEELRVLADEQAGLRRVATLVAGGAVPEEVFAGVTKEIGQLLPVEYAYLSRYEPDGTVRFVTAWGRQGAGLLGGRTRVPLGGNNLSTLVFETGRPGRIDDYERASGPSGVAAREAGVRCSVGTPIVVDGRLWGMMAAGSSAEEPLPADTEVRLTSFTELLAMAIANTESRSGLARLAGEQAALRGVATLVARGVPPDEVFAAVAEEVGRVLQVDSVGMARYDPDGTATSVAAWGTAVIRFPVGSQWIPEGKNLVTIVFETGRPAQIDDYADASGPVGLAARQTGFRSAAATPIVVEGRVWGVVVAGSSGEQPLLADIEARLASFTELVATAIADTQSRAALAASRARVVAAADETRRRIERDLHDGTQQRLVSLMLELRTAEATQPYEVGQLRAQLERTERGLAGVLEEVRELSRGIHPAILSKGGLERALVALARRSAVPVELDLRAERRLSAPVEVAAYYVVSEALTNVAKHAHASVVCVELDADASILQLAIRDDGVGGADPSHGSGLLGLSDRIEALGGTLEVTSPAGNGTTMLIEVPLGSSARVPKP
jgi:signal transduction histidine kinase